MNQTLRIDEVKRDAKTQARISTCNAAVGDYCEAMRRGAKFPSIVVFFDGEYYHLADGWQRVAAHEELGRKTIEADVCQGALRDAVLFAVGANKAHGVRMSNSDKANAVNRMLFDEEWTHWSDREIARHVGVSNSFVSKLRKKLETPSDDCTVFSENTNPASQNFGDSAAQSGEGGGIPDFLQVDEPLIDIESLAGPYQECLRLLTNAKRIIKECASCEENGRHLAIAITRICTDLDSARGSIRQMEPLRICVGCDGEGCRSCADCGWITRIMANDLDQRMGPQR